jgi:inosine/xanthosine triphosphate pyrophosphatase family protein
MKKLLIATTNNNKVSRIKRLLVDAPVEIMSLNDLPKQIPEPAETAGSGVEIAAQKALGYVEHVDDSLIVLTQDDTIAFEGVDDVDNPGPFIKEPVKSKYGEFTDENALKYYTDLAKKYGGTVPMVFRYGHAIAYKTKTERRRVTIIASSWSYMLAS